MSASTSSNERALSLLARIRSGECIPRAEVFEFGESYPAEFFRIVIESLSDSFDLSDVEAYQDLMKAWPVPEWQHRPIGSKVYVLSRVTLGADIKITSMVLNAMKTCFPHREVILVGSRKSAELFTQDHHLEVDYPRTGPMSARISFALALREKLADGIVVDPDSRISQLGHVRLAAPDSYFHFNSRTAGGTSLANLSQMTGRWLQNTFGATGKAYMAPGAVTFETERPRAALSLGVGGNDAKRIAGSFEANLIREVGKHYQQIWLDRGAGGDEATRVTDAARASGLMDRIRFWEGSFAGFASIIQQSNYYAGYDSAGQHAAAAAGVPLTTYFAGAPTTRFAFRWRPEGAGRISVRSR